MEEKKVAIVSAGVGALASAMVSKTAKAIDREVIIIDSRNIGKTQITEKLKEAGAEVLELGDVPHGYLQHEIQLPPLPNLFGEKKKKKPCTYHEYVHSSNETQAGKYGSITKAHWNCRHCGHPLK